MVLNSKLYKIKKLETEYVIIERPTNQFLAKSKSYDKIIEIYKKLKSGHTYFGGFTPPFMTNYNLDIKGVI